MKLLFGATLKVTTEIVMTNIDKKVKNDALIPSRNEFGFVSRSAMLAKRGLDSLNTLDRIVRFPSDISVGNVYIVNANSDCDRSFGALCYRPVRSGNDLQVDGIEEIANVRGNVYVSINDFLVLVVFDDENIPAISLLAPDSLQGLCLSGEEIPLLANLTDLRFLRISSFTDVGMPHLRDLTSLTSLVLSDTEITDVGISHISHLRSLKRLDLARTKITDEGLAHLSELTSLESLGFGGNNISGMGFAHLSKLKSLLRFSFDSSEITDEGLLYLSRLESLSHLYLYSPHITDLGLSYISKLTALTHLTVFSSLITDEGMSYLSELHLLKILELSSPNLTDAGLLHLYGLRNLGLLYVRDGLITQKGTAEMRERFPDSTISIWSNL